jgi:hypothetical protein
MFVPTSYNIDDAAMAISFPAPIVVAIFWLKTQSNNPGTIEEEST